MTDETQDETQLTNQGEKPNLNLHVEGGGEGQPEQEPGDNEDENIEDIEPPPEGPPILQIKISPQQIAALRLKTIREAARSPNSLTYEEFEGFAEIVKEFLVKSDLLHNVENNIFFSLKIIKADRDGFFNICGFVCNVPPEVIRLKPIVEVVDYMIVTNEFLEGVRLLDFFTLTSTILTKLITV